ncbi:MAG: UDP-glucose--hexose-1-phosphate uridylyltransferase [Lachnospiraceae bacterium]|nr:UDP-glucose--hexose-1-phosphate uridylyltransferase [Lachnospiraceae bacterium]
MSDRKVEKAVRALTEYGIKKKLICPEEAVYAANGLFDALRYEPEGDFSPLSGGENEHPAGNEDALSLEEILKVLLDDAVSRGVIEEGIASRDLFDTRLMGILTPRPGEVIREFLNRYERSAEEATDYFYALSCDSDYIRTARVARDLKWVTETEYGKLDITINLSKPEKDPRAIAEALKKKDNAYPRCLLCPENEGYAGRLDHPARQTIRLIPVELDGDKWFMQYSPYVYYNEHCIVLSKEHVPMKIDRHTFVRLFDFLDYLPHYTIGSNADLPIVGGSILSHEHFQGGRYTFAMAKASVREKISFRGFEELEAGVLNWPMSVIRLRGKDREKVTDLCELILSEWRNYSDEKSGILSESGGEKHNTITPIARMRDGQYEIDLALRNNATTEEHPLGIFHPHKELHHIKKENIGLIEVMGLAILPFRLLGEMQLLKETILAGKAPESEEALLPHAEWAAGLLDKYPAYRPENVASNGTMDGLTEILRKEIGLVFCSVLEHCGVFKDTPEGRDAFGRFVAAVNTRNGRDL